MKKYRKRKKKTTCSNCKKVYYKERVDNHLKFLRDTTWRCRLCGAFNYN